MINGFQSCPLEMYAAAYIFKTKLDLDIAYFGFGWDSDIRYIKKYQCHTMQFGANTCYLLAMSDWPIDHWQIRLKIQIIICNFVRVIAYWDIPCETGPRWTAWDYWWLVNIRSGLSTICVMSVWSNCDKCKYMFMFPQNKIRT